MDPLNHFRRYGVFARVFHFDADKLNLMEESGHPLDVPRNTKYLTICNIHDQVTGDLKFQTRALCRKGDTPSRKLGFKLATGRAKDFLEKVQSNFVVDVPEYVKYFNNLYAE